MDSFDAVVIGSGLSGFMAASTLRQQQKSVLVLSKGTGASSVSSGAVDFGPIASNEKKSLSKLCQDSDWQKSYRQILVANEAALSPTVIERHLEFLNRSLSEYLPIKYQLDSPCWLATSQGTWKPTFVAQGQQMGNSLHELSGKKVAFLYGENWRIVGAPIAKQLKLEAQALGVELDVTPMRLSGGGADCPLPHVSARLNADESFRSKFFEEAATKSAEFDAVILPPLLLKWEHWQSLSEKIRVPVSECLASVEPTAGKRLQDAIVSSFSKQDISHEFAEHFLPVTNGDQVSAIEVWKQGETERRKIEAKAFVLATGKFFGGGVELGYEHVKETVFDLPLFWERSEEQVRNRSQILWAERHFDEAQAWAQLGLWVDANWRPIGSDGKPVYQNVHACGSVIGGLDFSKAGIGLGFMTVSGGECGLMAAKT